MSDERTTEKPGVIIHHALDDPRELLNWDKIPPYELRKFGNYDPKEKLPMLNAPEIVKTVAEIHGESRAELLEAIHDLFGPQDAAKAGAREPTEEEREAARVLERNLRQRQERVRAEGKAKVNDVIASLKALDEDTRNSVLERIAENIGFHEAAKAAVDDVAAVASAEVDKEQEEADKAKDAEAQKAAESAGKAAKVAPKAAAAPKVAEKPAKAEKTKAK